MKNRAYIKFVNILLRKFLISLVLISIIAPINSALAKEDIFMQNRPAIDIDPEADEALLDDSAEDILKPSKNKDKPRFFRENEINFEPDPLKTASVPSQNIRRSNTYNPQTNLSSFNQRQLGNQESPLASTAQQKYACANLMELSK